MQIMLVFFALVTALVMVAALTYLRPRHVVRDRRAQELHRKWKYAPPESEAAAERLRPSNRPIRS